MCEQHERLLDYLYDEVSATSRTEVEQHLAGCDDCREDIRAFRRVREDLLAWEVPRQTSVWTPFAPAPVVPWFRQVPAWAMAAAAGLMFVMGGAGASTALALGSTGGTEAVTVAATPAAVDQEPGLDAESVTALVRQQLSSVQAELAEMMTPAAATVPATFKLDAATEKRLLAQASEIVGQSEERQMAFVTDFLYEVAREADLQRKADGQAMGALQARVDQLNTIVSQLLVLQQTKVQ